MENPNPESSPPEPIQLPTEPPLEPLVQPKKYVRRRSDEIVISKTTLYYFLIAGVFFAAGFFSAWVMYNLRSDDIRTTASNAARQAVTTAIAYLSGVAAATATPIPRQNITISN